MQADNRFAVAWHTSFTPEGIGHTTFDRLMTVQEIFEALPVDVQAQVQCAQINGVLIERERWKLVRPHISSEVAVTFHGAAQGGNDSGAKQLVTGVALIALSVWTGGHSFIFSKGLTGALFNAGVSLAISGGLTMLAGTPKTGGALDDGAGLEKNRNASLQGNVAAPNSYLPRVVGTHKVYPPFVQPPLVEIIDNDEVVEAVYGLAGPHAFGRADIYMQDVELANAEDIELEWRNGLSTDTALTFVQRQSVTFEVNTKVSQHDIADGSPNALRNQASPDLSCPVWHSFSSRVNVDEFWLQMYFPQGTLNVDADTAPILIPFLVRIRERGAAAWINCPELIYANVGTGQKKFTIKFMRGADRAATATPAGRALGVREATRIGAAGGTWTADPYFGTGTRITTNASTGIMRNVALFYDRAEIYLDESFFDMNLFEVQIKQGTPRDSYAVTSHFNTFTGNRYQYQTVSGVRYAPIGNATRTSYQAVVARSCSIWNEHPTPVVGDAAYVAIKSKNRQLGQLHIIAGGLVQATAINYLSERINAGAGYSKFSANNGLQFYSAGSGVVKKYSAASYGLSSSYSPGTAGVSALLPSGLFGDSISTAFFNGSYDNIWRPSTTPVGGPNPFRAATYVGSKALFAVGNGRIVSGMELDSFPNAEQIKNRVVGPASTNGNWFAVAPLSQHPVNIHHAVAVGAAGSVLVFDRDFTNIVTSAPATTQQLNGVASNGGAQIVAVGNGGAIVYSNDYGATFNAAVSPSAANLNAIVHLTNGGSSRYYAVGNGVVLHSTDGVTWTQQNMQFGANWTDIKYNSSTNEVLIVSDAGVAYHMDENSAANYTSTSDPSVHYKEFLSGDIAIEPVPATLVDTAGIDAWGLHCRTKGYAVNGIIQDQSALETLNLLASVGYGQPYMSEVWSVIYERDRSNDLPVQVFTPVNSSDFSYKKAFPRIADVVRAEFVDSNAGYDRGQIIVSHATASPTNPRIEQISYWGMITQPAVEIRANFDLAVYRERGVLYSWSCDLENIVCRRGDLVAVATDVLSSTQGYARVLTKTVAAGFVTSVTLDATLTFAAGANAAAIRFDNGAVTVVPINETGVDSNTLTFTTPFPDSVFLGDGVLVSTGPSTKEYRRVIVAGVEPQSDLTANITAFDEAPQLAALI